VAVASQAYNGDHADSENAKCRNHYQDGNQPEAEPRDRADYATWIGRSSTFADEGVVADSWHSSAHWHTFGNITSWCTLIKRCELTMAVLSLQRKRSTRRSMTWRSRCTRTRTTPPVNLPGKRATHSLHIRSCAFFVAAAVDELISSWIGWQVSLVVRHFPS